MTREGDAALASRYTTIVADPPWRYQKDTSMGTKQGAAEGHYTTLAMPEIAALPIKSLAADNAHLYLWVTVPRLHGDRDDRSFMPIDILDAWGFEFKTMLTWVKPGRGGMGWYFRGQTEHVLFGVRGSLPIPPAIREPNVILAPRSKHSKKPDAFFDLVERVSPGPYLELFAREKRIGWDSWGNEVESDVELVA